jgi:hypothetical protein
MLGVGKVAGWVCLGISLGMVVIIVCWNAFWKGEEKGKTEEHGRGEKERVKRDDERGDDEGVMEDWRRQNKS